jgi:hypothetical protein
LAELAAQAVVAPGALNGGGGGVGRAAPAVAVLQQFQSLLGQLRTQLTLEYKGKMLKMCMLKFNKTDGVKVLLTTVRCYSTYFSI